MPDTTPLSVSPEPQTVPQFARKHKVGVSTVWSWIAQGRLTATKLGPNVTRILPEHEATWLAVPKAEAEARAASNREKSAA